MITDHLPPDVGHRVDLLRLRGFLTRLGAGGWVTPAERQRAYAAADRLSGLAGEDALTTIDELRAILDVVERAHV